MIYRQGNWGTEKFGKFFKITGMVSGRAEYRQAPKFQIQPYDTASSPEVTSMAGITREFQYLVFLYSIGKETQQ